MQEAKAKNLRRFEEARLVKTTVDREHCRENNR